MSLAAKVVIVLLVLLLLYHYHYYCEYSERAKQRGVYNKCTRERGAQERERDLS